MTQNIRIEISFSDQKFVFFSSLQSFLQHSFYLYVIVDCGLTHHKIAIHNSVYKLKIALKMINLRVDFVSFYLYISKPVCRRATNNKVNVQISVVITAIML